MKLHDALITCCSGAPVREPVKRDKMVAVFDAAKAAAGIIKKGGGVEVGGWLGEREKA